MSLLDDLGLVPVTPVQFEGTMINPLGNANSRIYYQPSFTYTLPKHESKRMYNVKSKFPFLVYGLSTQRWDTEADFWESEQEATMVSLDRTIKYWEDKVKLYQKNNRRRLNEYKQQQLIATETKIEYFEENAEYFI